MTLLILPTPVPAPIIAKQTALTATGTTAQAVPVNNLRRRLRIQIYAFAPGTTTSQTGLVYVSFTAPATLGTAGEIEMIGGQTIEFGGYEPNNEPMNAQPYFPSCPLDAINVIAVGGTMYGSIVEF